MTRTPGREDPHSSEVTRDIPAIGTGSNTSSSSSIHATFDGEPIEADPGTSVAAALMASGQIAWRPTRSGQPRGLFCGIGICFDCLVEIDGESGQRACMIPLVDGMVVR